MLCVVVSMGREREKEEKRVRATGLTLEVEVDNGDLVQDVVLNQASTRRSASGTKEDREMVEGVQMITPA
jgi:ribosomal protein L4